MPTLQILFAGLLALPLVASCMSQEYYVEDYPPAGAQVEIYPNAPSHHHHHHDYPQYRPVAQAHIHPDPVRPRPVIIHTHPQVTVHRHHRINQPVIRRPAGATAVVQVPGQVRGHNAPHVGPNNTQTHTQPTHGTSHAHH